MFRKTALIFTLFFSLVSIQTGHAFDRTNKQILGNSAAMWDGLNPDQRVELIAALIDKLKELGTVIKKEPAFYAEEIELTRLNDPHLYTKPIGKLFRTTAILYRDFDNGKDPNELIKNHMDELDYEVYVNNNIADAMEEKYEAWMMANEQKLVNSEQE